MIDSTINKALKGIDKELNGLTDLHLKYLSYMIKYEFKIDNFRIEIDPKPRKRSIIIKCFDKNMKPVYIKPKNPEYMKKLPDVLNLKKWKINFEEKK